VSFPVEDGAKSYDLAAENEISFVGLPLLSDNSWAKNCAPIRSRMRAGGVSGRSRSRSTCGSDPTGSCWRASVTVSVGFGAGHLESEKVTDAMSCDEKLSLVFQKIASEHGGAFFAGSTLGFRALESPRDGQSAAAGGVTFHGARGGGRKLVVLQHGGSVDVTDDHQD
jgi:hypothetical protein